MDSVGECEGLSIQREAHHQPLPVRPEAHPVLQAVVGIEVLTGVSFRHVERRQVTRLAVSVVLLGLTAAVSSSPRGLKVALRAVTTSEKPSRSVRGPALQSTCQHMG